MNILEIEGLRKTYRAPDSSIQTVVDISAFAMPAGSQIALYGGSGSGKTTFLNLIAGILRPDSGKIFLDGWDMASHGEAARDAMRAKTVGYIFQTFNLLQGYTALENIELAMMFGSRLDIDFARRLLDRVGLQDRRSYRARQLSVGQQQRVAIARALANRPKLVLADEPTGNLDRERAQDAITLIRELCAENGASLLIVSHDLEVQRQFDDKISLADINRGGKPA